ncbi:MAG: FapA family protein [Synergistaceae bacterium]|nr:FapA family protein [Synergistaceae bacterium]
MKQDLVLLEARKDGIFINLAEGEECPSLPLLLQFLGLKGILKFDNKSVEAFVRAQGKSPYKIAERNLNPENDAVITVSVSKDHMEASVNITPPFFTKPWPTLAQIRSALAEKNIVYGIDDNVISDIINNRVSNEPVVAAKGIGPVVGKDGWVEVKIDLSSKTDRSENNKERIDHRERGLIINVSQGDVLAVRFPPTDGIDGISVSNVPIKAKPGKEIPFPNGAGTVVSEDGSTLLAEISGCLKKIDNRLTISPELNVSGDVDFHVGNIDFVGVVKIKGAVKDGFRVIAAGDIEIAEVVEGAHVESKGDILIRGGVRGMDKARIIAAGRIDIGFVDQAELTAGGDVLVHNAALHSDIFAGGSVIVSGSGKSQIAGGKIQAAIEVSCSTMGSEMGTKTEVIVGVSPVYAARKKELVASLSAYNENMEKIEANLTFLKKLEAAQALDDDKRALLISITKTKFQVQAQLQNATKELHEIDQMLETTKAQGIVRVKDVCYSGVSITIRGYTYLIREPFKFCSFVFEEGEVKLRSYDYRS